MAYAPVMNSEFIVSYFGTLSREISIDVSTSTQTSPGWSLKMTDEQYLALKFMRSAQECSGMTSILARSTPNEPLSTFLYEAFGGLVLISAIFGVCIEVDRAA